MSLIWNPKMDREHSRLCEYAEQGYQPGQDITRREAAWRIAIGLAVGAGMWGVMELVRWWVRGG